jgi:5,10-methenyltetrahydrofolate synthetase
MTGARGFAEVAEIRERPSANLDRRIVVASYRSWRSEPGTRALNAVLSTTARLIVPFDGDLTTPSWRWLDKYDRAPDAHGPVGVSEADTDPGIDGTGPGHLSNGVADLSLAQVIFIPALAVDTRGTRLGQGLGWYDKALRAASPDATRIAVVYESEVYDGDQSPLPRDRHDQPVDAYLTPTGWGWTTPENRRRSSLQAMIRGSDFEPAITGESPEEQPPPRRPAQ